jgi:very-short-patch-repair endonuclease
MGMKNIEKSFFYNASPEIFRRAKELRKNLTPSEKILWAHLKENKFEGIHFRRQHPINKFIVDFYCHELLLVIEIDGEIHSEEAVAERDEGREIELQRLGLTVFRFKNEEVLNDIKSVREKIKSFIEKGNVTR